MMRSRPEDVFPEPFSEFPDNFSGHQTTDDHSETSNSSSTSAAEDQPPSPPPPTQLRPDNYSDEDSMSDTDDDQPTTAADPPKTALDPPIPSNNSAFQPYVKIRRLTFPGEIPQPPPRPTPREAAAAILALLKPKQQPKPLYTPSDSEDDRATLVRYPNDTPPSLPTTTRNPDPFPRNRTVTAPAETTTEDLPARSSPTDAIFKLEQQAVVSESATYPVPSMPHPFVAALHSRPTPSSDADAIHRLQVDVAELYRRSTTIHQGTQLGLSRLDQHLLHQHQTTRRLLLQVHHLKNRMSDCERHLTNQLNSPPPVPNSN